MDEAALGVGRVMSVVHSRSELAHALDAVPRERRAVVMTMGALHEGHASLIDIARSCVGGDGQVLVTIYVNPLQFNDAADLERYPRTLAADAALAAQHGVDVLWVPQAVDVFPQGPEEFATEPGELGAFYEGAARPGHFAGMLTVVRALLEATAPGFAIFGEKDYQQLALIRAMVEHQALDVEIVAAPTVREPDGLALSSRNRFLSDAQRTEALALSRALAAGADAADAGRSADAVTEAAREVIDAAGITLDYLTLVGENFTPVPDAGAARMLIAAKVGEVRLIDNAPIHLRGRQ